MDSPITSISDRLSVALEKRGVSAVELSKRTGISKASISQYKNGVVNPKQDRIFMIAQALNISEAWLMGYDVPMDRSRSLLNKKNSSETPANVSPVPDLSGLKKIPMLGSIACGEPITALREYEYVEINELIKADFCLRAEGNSMIDAGIFNGSLVLCKDAEEVEDGQIAAVLIEGEATLKKVYNYGSVLILKPCNRDFEDLVYKGEELNRIRIIGKAIGCINKL